MKLQVFKKLSLSDASLTEHSAAIDMAGANSVLVSFVVAEISSGGTEEVFVSLEQSNDAQNWQSPGMSTGGRFVGYYELTPWTSVRSRYVRVRCEIEPGGAEGVWSTVSVDASVYQS